MASVTLTGARTFHHGGVKFVKDKSKTVSEAVANELKEFPDYFPHNLIKMGGDTGKVSVQPVAVKTGSTKFVKKTVTPAATDEPGVEV